MDIKQLDWNEYHKYIDKLADKIKKHITIEDGDNVKILPDGTVDPLPYKYVAGLEPDDMFIAVHLSHKLGIPAVTDINVLSLLSDFTNNTQQVLIVSNIVKTGNTFRNIMNQTGSEFDTAVLFKDKESKYKPTHYIEIPKSHIYFPWEECGIQL